MKKIVFLLLVLVPLSAYPNEWKVWTAALGSIPEDNYYQILLPAELTGQSRHISFPGIRLLNSEGTAIPYFIRSGSIREELNELTAYPLIENSGKDSLNTLVIHNPDKEQINSFLIISQPAEVSRWVQVRGSNDRKNWFITKQFRNVTQQVYRLREYEVTPVTFPEGNYLYYEVNLKTNEKSPLDIAMVVKEESHVHDSPLSLLPVPSISQKDSSDHFSYLTFSHLPHSYWYDKVVFHVKYPADYYRTGSSVGDNYSFTLSSYQSNTLFPGKHRLTPESYFRISNDHNPPLVIDSIRFYSVAYYACTFLSAGEQYTLTLDESLDSRPSYDIEHFRTKIPEDIPVVTLSSPTATIHQTVPQIRERLWIEQPAVLWSIILLTGLFLAVMCFFVIKEMKNRP
ncbi:MAG: hypothetical protein LUG98_07230 [Tannerellaceae bacterium]|nr:hypothetical protein [Tannerellaceae bacterium]